MVFSYTGVFNAFWIDFGVCYKKVVYFHSTFYVLIKVESPVSFDISQQHIQLEKTAAQMYPLVHKVRLQITVNLAYSLQGKNPGVH